MILFILSALLTFAACGVAWRNRCAQKRAGVMATFWRIDTMRCAFNGKPPKPSAPVLPLSPAKPNSIASAPFGTTLPLR